MSIYFQDETTTLHCADNAAVLPTLAVGSIDLVFTSPPYNLGNTTGGGLAQYKGHYDAAGGMKKRGGQGKWRNAALADGYASHDDSMPHAEYVAWQHSILWQCWGLLAEAGAIFYNHKPRILNGTLIAPADYVPTVLRAHVRQEIIWARSGGINFSPSFYVPTHERIVVIAHKDFRLKSKGASGVGDVWRITQETDNSHPAPFPVELPSRALETTTAQTILDPFAGSGTTGVACALHKRKFVGIELSEEYCAMAKARILRAKGIPHDAPKSIRRQIETPLFATA